MKESISYHSIKFSGFLVRLMPVQLALFIGKVVGLFSYYFNTKLKSQAYANIKCAFSHKKDPIEIKRLTRKVFIHYGQNFIELLRLPLISKKVYNDLVEVEGKEHLEQSLEKGKGAIFLAMHFGSWELASMMCAMKGLPYKVLVKHQDRYSKLDELLNEYRSASGSVVLSKGLGTRDLIRSLKDNQVIGLVVDQGGKDGVMVPFFDRQASMSIGAIRLALKMDVPICFSYIFRQRNGKHKMIVREPLDLVKTGNTEEDIEANLRTVTKYMEEEIERHPEEYMWFYKIWKYSKENNLTVLTDEKTGHKRQSETIAKISEDILTERGETYVTKYVDIEYRNNFRKKILPIVALLTPRFMCQGRPELLKWFLKDECYNKLMSRKSDTVISTGAKLSAVNYFLSQDHNAKSIVILKPGMMSFERFTLVILPQHDVVKKESKPNEHMMVTRGAPNLVNKDFLEKQTEALLKRYSHLKNLTRFTIGVFVGGNTKNVKLDEPHMKMFIHQIRESAKAVNANILITTSRRTPEHIENLIYREFKKDERCPLVVIANKQDVPEAVGGILGLSDLVVVSGDSISMVSEAASSGKYTVVFSTKKNDVMLGSRTKHERFVDNLNSQGFVLSSNVKDISHSIMGIAKNKIQTRKIDDNEVIKEALRFVV